MRRLYSFPFLFALIWAIPAFAQGKTMLVLDGSGSMWGQINGTTKIQIARDVLRDVLGTIPPNMEMGLVVYGHRQEGICSDIEVAVPVGPGTAEQISRFADRVTPRGMTPLSAAVRVAAEELKYKTQPTNIVLVTDGIETCHADPCAVAEELEKHGIDLTVHVVGFGISDDEEGQVACLAERTGGRYLSAADAEELSEALVEIVPSIVENLDSADTEPPAKAPPLVQEPAEAEANLSCVARLSEGSQPMADNAAVHWEFFRIGEDGNPAAHAEFSTDNGICETHLAPGRYLARARLGNLVQERKIVLTGDEKTEVEAVFDAGFVIVTAKHSAQDTKPLLTAKLKLISRDGMTEGEGSLSAYVRAGPVTASAQADGATVYGEDTVTAGEETNIDLILGSGTVSPSAMYAAGQPTKAGDPVHYELVASVPNAEGEHAVFPIDLDRTSVDVPPGEYLLRTRLGKAEATIPVVVEPGKTIEPSVNLDAGTLHVIAPGAYQITFLDAFGMETLSGSYGEEALEFFNPGPYQVRVAYDDWTHERFLVATVQAGERTQVEIEYKTPAN